MDRRALIALFGKARRPYAPSTMLRSLTIVAVIAVAAVSAGRVHAQNPASPCLAQFEATGSTVCVQGGPAAVQLELHRTTIAAALSALFAAYRVSYRSSVQLDEQRDGTYKGPLRHVISRLLDGYNYAIRQENANIEVMVISKKGEQPVPGLVLTQASQDRAEIQAVRKR
jgi:hypothetical protein